jgi:hypothetical protein
MVPLTTEWRASHPAASPPKPKEHAFWQLTLIRHLRRALGSITIFDPMRTHRRVYFMMLGKSKTRRKAFMTCTKPATLLCTPAQTSGHETDNAGPRARALCMNRPANHGNFLGAPAPEHQGLKALLVTYPHPQPLR